MTRIIRWIAALALFTSITVARAEAQTAQDLVGTWTLVSATIQAGEVKMDVYGPDPKGTLMFGRDGRYALIFMRRDLPKLTYNTRMSQTVEESRAITKGSIAHFGTYKVDEAGKFLILRIEGSTFPNWVGEEQKLKIDSLTADELIYSNLAGSIAGATTLNIWRRAK